jgi:hypothetical protein
MGVRWGGTNDRRKGERRQSRRRYDVDPLYVPGPEPSPAAEQLRSGMVLVWIIAAVGLALVVAGLYVAGWKP